MPKIRNFRMNSKQWLALARQATTMAIQNSEIVQGYVKPSHYRRILFGLNALNVALKVAEGKK